MLLCIVVKVAVKNVGLNSCTNPLKAQSLAPGEFYLICKLRSDFRGKKFNDDDEKKKGTDLFGDKLSDYFFRDIDLLIKRYEKCIEIQGDYELVKFSLLLF